MSPADPLSRLLSAIDAASAHGGGPDELRIVTLSMDDALGLREQIETPTNPRYLLWRVWHGDNPSMRIWDYTAWSDKRWTEFCAVAKRDRRSHSLQDHADFDAWLRHWVRREIATTVARADAF